MNENELKKYLNRFIEKDVVINIIGFLEGKYLFSKMNYYINDGILTIEGADNYLKIILSQVYKTDTTINLKLYLDNDTTITIDTKKSM